MGNINGNEPMLSRGDTPAYTDTDQLYVWRLMYAHISQHAMYDPTEIRRWITRAEFWIQHWVPNRAEPVYVRPLAQAAFGNEYVYMYEHITNAPPKYFLGRAHRPWTQAPTLFEFSGVGKIEVTNNHPLADWPEEPTSIVVSPIVMTQGAHFYSFFATPTTQEQIQSWALQLAGLRGSL